MGHELPLSSEKRMTALPPPHHTLAVAALVTGRALTKALERFLYGEPWSHSFYPAELRVRGVHLADWPGRGNGPE